MVPVHPDALLVLGADVNAGDKGVGRHLLLYRYVLAGCLGAAVELVQVMIGCDTCVAVERGALVDVVGVRALVLAGPLELVTHRATARRWVDASLGQVDKLLMARPGGRAHGDLDVDVVDGRIRGRRSCQPGTGDKDERADGHCECGMGWTAQSLNGTDT